jgi:two-component sensor histidine kinase
MIIASHDHDHQVLIREYHHRLANQLQVMMGIVMKSRQAADRQGTLHLLTELEGRIRAFAGLNRLLAYPADAISLEDYCRDLCRLLVRAFGRDGITPNVSFDRIQLGPTEMMYVALMVVELTINELKHGLRQCAVGSFDVRLRHVADCAELMVSDDEPVPVTARPFPVPRMVEALAQRVGGDVIVLCARSYGVRVRFPLSDTAMGEDLLPCRLVHAELRTM